MNKISKGALVALRIGLGWLFFYAGITKVINPDWSAAGFLNNAGFLPGFFEWLALPGNIVWVNFLNEWGLTLIGISLILGLLVKYSSVLGSLMMLLYYVPELSTFPWIGDHSFIVDEHIVYILALGVLCAFCAGNYFGLDKYLSNCNRKEGSDEDVNSMDYHL